MRFVDQAIAFSCADEQLLGIVTDPATPLKTGVLIVVGGPQYRVGSHRQFVLLSRALAAAGYPVMRFDYRGMGDSSGEQLSFEACDDDIAAAITAFRNHCKQLENVVLWGLCDAATAALLYLERTRDDRISGLVLLNPWMRSTATLARTHIKHYYTKRLFQRALWFKLLKGELAVGRAIGGLLSSLLQLRRVENNAGRNGRLSYQESMLRGLSEFRGVVLLILSGDDYTAKEFVESTLGNSVWQAVLGGENVVTKEVVDADHTFSSAGWRAEVERLTVDWLDGNTGAYAPKSPCTIRKKSVVGVL